MDSACDQVSLNKLLNEMDGLREDADVFFVLTTNRPETLEAALAERPGRIDQAIEFPLPDEEGRRRLVELYGGSATLEPESVTEIVRRTSGVSAAFIKELMRRSAQQAVSVSESEPVRPAHVRAALDEMLLGGGKTQRATARGRVGVCTVTRPLMRFPRLRSHPHWLRDSLYVHRDGALPRLAGVLLPAPVEVHQPVRRDCRSCARAGRSPAYRPRSVTSR